MHWSYWYLFNIFVIFFGSFMYKTFFIKKIFFFFCFFCVVIEIFNLFLYFSYFYLMIEAFHLKRIQIASVRPREYWDYVSSYILAYIVSSIVCWYCNLSKREMFSVSLTLRMFVLPLLLLLFFCFTAMLLMHSGCNAFWSKRTHQAHWFGMRRPATNRSSAAQ